MKPLITTLLFLLITIGVKSQAGREFFMDAMNKESIGKYKEAVEAYDKCIAVEPIAEAYYNRAHAKYKLKRVIMMQLPMYWRLLKLNLH